MTRPNIDILQNALFLDLGAFRLWVERLTQEKAPFPPHPKDHRWGIAKDNGETCLYLGSLLVIFTPRAVIQRDREAVRAGKHLQGSLAQ